MPFIPVQYNPAKSNRPPIAELSPLPDFTHIGELLTVYGSRSTDPEGGALTYKWSFLRVPSNSKLTSLTLDPTDPSVAKFVADAVGIYEIQLIVNDGLLDSAPVTAITVARQLPIPHGQAYAPDMRWMFSFIRDWITMIEDRDRIATLWSAATQLASEVLLRLYEVNLSKSIKTIPELIQQRWEMLRLRVDLPESYLLSFNKREVGIEGSSLSSGTEETGGVLLERPLSISKGNRTISFGGLPRSIRSNSTLQPYTDNFGVPKMGTRLAVSPAVPPAIQHAYWQIPTGSVQFDNSSAYDLRCFAGDLLALEMRLGNASAIILCRIYAVTSDGRVGFEITRGPLQDDYEYKLPSGDYKPEVIEQIEQALLSLDVDPGRFTFNQLGRELLDLLLIGDYTSVQKNFGITFQPKYILRLSRFYVDPNTISVPYLQSNVLNPVFILRQNEDYVLQSDTDGVYVQLVDSVILDEGNLPRALWAEVAYLDNAETIEDNFGILVGGERDKLPSRVTDHTYYRGAVAGLMYAFSTGPTPQNIRLGVQIVLGLPFTVERGIIRLIDPTYTAEEGLIIIEDVDENDDPTGRDRVYTYPLTAQLESHGPYLLPLQTDQEKLVPNPQAGEVIQVGDFVPRFFPLVTGVQVLDRVNTPDWWSPLYDGGARLPKYHEAFFEDGWYPNSNSVWPDSALEVFQEPQKTHFFEVRLDPTTFDVEDVTFAKRFVRGVQQTWRLGLEKKGIRPHYTDALIIVTLSQEDQLTVRDRVTFEATFVPVDDSSGYEASIREGHRNSSGDLLVYQDAPLRSSRSTPPPPNGQFVAPTVNGLTASGAVRLDLDTYANGPFQVGEVITTIPPSPTVATVLAVDTTGLPGTVVNETLLVSYGADGLVFGPWERISGVSSGATASIMNETPVILQLDVDMTLTAGDDASYHLTRYRDLAWVETPGIYGGRYGIFRVNPVDTKQLIIYQLRSDDPTVQPPLPHGISSPNGTSSYRPLTMAERVAWQEDSTVFRTHIERPYHNPINSSELYQQDPAKVKIAVTGGSSGFHDFFPASHFHTDNFRSGYMLRVQNPGGANHLDEFEIIRDTDGSTAEELSDLSGWSASSASPYLRTYGPLVPGVSSYDYEVYDPRLPYTKHLAGETLPPQGARPDDFSVILPVSSASGVDGFYEGMYFRALTGAGAWKPGTQLGHWLIVGYDGSSGFATLARNHRGVFDSTTVFEIVSFRPEDNSIVHSTMRDLFPADMVEASFLAAVKASDPLAGSPCTLVITSGISTVTALNIASVLPGGLDFVTPNGIPELPFDPGSVLPGDRLVLTPQSGATAADLALCAIPYTVTGSVGVSSFDVYPVPAYTSSPGGVFFTIFRPVPTTYVWDGAFYVPNPPVLFTPVPQWSIF